MMTPEQIEAGIVALAKLEGYEVKIRNCGLSRTCLHKFIYNPSGEETRTLPDYLNDDAAMDRVLRSKEFNDEKLLRYDCEICRIVNRGWGSQYLATAPQKLEAACRALGVVQ